MGAKGVTVFTLTSSAATRATDHLITKEASIAPLSTSLPLRSTSSTSRTRAGNSNPGVAWGQLAKTKAHLGIADTRITIGEELTSADPLIGNKEELRAVRTSLSVIWGPPTALLIIVDSIGAMSTDPKLSARCEAIELLSL